MNRNNGTLQEKANQTGFPLPDSKAKLQEASANGVTVTVNQVETLEHAEVVMTENDFEKLTSKLDRITSMKRKMSITPEYKSFKTVNESVRGSFVGIHESQTKRSGMLPGVYWIGIDRILYFNQGMILVDETKKAIEKKLLNPGDNIEIVYKGKKPTKNAEADDFRVFILDDEG